MTMRLLQLGRRQAWERNSPRPFRRRCANYGTAVTRHCTVIALEYMDTYIYIYAYVCGRLTRVEIHRTYATRIFSSPYLCASMLRALETDSGRFAWSPERFRRVLAAKDSHRISHSYSDCNHTTSLIDYNWPQH